MAEDVARAFLHADLFARRTVGDAGLMIDVHPVVLITHRLGRADLDAQLTADASHLADGGNSLAGIFGGTGHPYPGPQTLDFDDLLRTRFDAYPATYTQIGINNGKAINHLDGVEGTCSGTFTQTDAGVLTGDRAAEAEVCGGTRVKTDITVFIGDIAFRP